MAAAYGGDLDEARALNLADRRRIVPERARHHPLRRRRDRQPRWCLGRRPSATTARRCGPQRGKWRDVRTTRIAAVGLVSVQAASGDIDAALRGHADLIDYWERTGAWTQQWTTLRNLADLLDQLEDHDCASLLRRAADEAPEAASTAVVSALDVLERDEVDAPAPAPSPSLARSRALDAARQAIARHLAIVSEG